MTAKLMSVNELIMRQIIILFIALLALPESAMAQVEVAEYYGNRKAAVSYTFDDGMEEHYTLLFPELKKRGIKGTFAINGASIVSGRNRNNKVTWAQLREMAADGQEMSNHAWKHRKLTRLSDEDMRVEVQRNDTLIYDSVGVFPRTFIYPYNSKSNKVVEFCSRDRVGTRIEQVSVGSKRDSTWLRHWVDGLIEKGEWGIGMTHGITNGYDSIGTDPSRFWHHLDYACSQQDQLWIATFHDVSAYKAERENIQLTVKEKKRKITVKPHLTLDRSLFHHPLTLIVNTDRPVRVKQDGKPIDVIHKDGKAVFNFNPHGGKITIRLL